ncbi:unnamed protein product, partial [Vitis vinifera]|uniref:Uncharacterized protein n=1 Tax=Vitis vinifera TaxID=29760 RepID=D7TX88_VITVI
MFLINRINLNLKLCLDSFDMLNWAIKNGSFFSTFRKERIKRRCSWKIKMSESIEVSKALLYTLEETSLTFLKVHDAEEGQRNFPHL